MNLFNHPGRPLILKRMWGKTKIDGTCWRWIGYKQKNGYGQVGIFGRIGKIYYVHRVSLSLHDPDFDLDSQFNANHKRECPNRDCWNPEHLYKGTQSQNLKDAIALGRARPIGHRGSRPLNETLKKEE